MTKFQSVQEQDPLFFERLFIPWLIGGFNILSTIYKCFFPMRLSSSERLRQRESWEIDPWENQDWICQQPSGQIWLVKPWKKKHPSMRQPPPALLILRFHPVLVVFFSKKKSSLRCASNRGFFHQGAGCLDQFLTDLIAKSTQRGHHLFQDFHLSPASESKARRPTFLCPPKRAWWWVGFHHHLSSIV